LHQLDKGLLILGESLMKLRELQLVELVRVRDLLSEHLKLPLLVLQFLPQVAQNLAFDHKGEGFDFAQMLLSGRLRNVDDFAQLRN